MGLVDRLSDDLTAAMKARDAARTSALRMAKAALKNKEIEKRGALEEAEAVRVLQAMVKQREESIEQFRRGNRPELAAREQIEIDFLRAYLPAEATEADIASAVEKAVSDTAASSPRDMGRVMKAALAALQDRGLAVDGRKVSEAARKRLGG